MSSNMIKSIKLTSLNTNNNIKNFYLQLQLTGLLIAVGTAILFADPTYAVSVVQDSNNYYIGLSILLVIGLILVIVAFLGCCGAFKESQCLLVTVSLITTELLIITPQKP